MIWTDAQLSPHLAAWITTKVGVPTQSVRDLDLRDAEDIEIFWAAKKAGASTLTKDKGFKEFLNDHEPPPQVIWLRCGNVKERDLRSILKAKPPTALETLEAGASVVEIH